MQPHDEWRPEPTRPQHPTPPSDHGGYVDRGPVEREDERRPVNGLAVASLVLGILWIFWLGSILAVVFGHVALGQIRRGRQSGRGMAIAGLTLGWIGLGILVLLMLTA